MTNLLPNEPADPVFKANFTRLANGRTVRQLRAEMASCGITIGVSALTRAFQGRTGNVRTLGKLADFFRVTPEQLLQPDLGAGVMAWPFSAELYQNVTKLKPKELQRLETAMRVHLDMDLPRDVINRTLEAAEPGVPSSKRGNREKTREF